VRCNKSKSNRKSSAPSVSLHRPAVKPASARTRRGRTGEGPPTTFVGLERHFLAASKLSYRGVDCCCCSSSLRQQQQQQDLLPLLILDLEDDRFKCSVASILFFYSRSLGFSILFSSLLLVTVANEKCANSVQSGQK